MNLTRTHEVNQQKKTCFFWLPKITIILNMRDDGTRQKKWFVPVWKSWSMEQNWRRIVLCRLFSTQATTENPFLWNRADDKWAKMMWMVDGLGGGVEAKRSSLCAVLRWKWWMCALRLCFGYCGVVQRARAWLAVVVLAQLAGKAENGAIVAERS